MGNATLEFGEGSVVAVESRFENCEITLKDGAQLVIGEYGSLQGCTISGGGEIVIEGSVSENGTSPSILGPKRLIVGKAGALMAAVKQGAKSTEFGFERGCYLRLRIER